MDRRRTVRGDAGSDGDAGDADGGAHGPSRAAVFVISVAAELAGMHPQTLRQYDRLGLVVPARTKGRGRRYSSHDIQRLRDIQHMSQDEGISLAGIQRILELQSRIEDLESERSRLSARLAAFEERRDRVFAASTSGEVSPLRRGERPWAGEGAGDREGAMVRWDPWEAFNLQAVAAAARVRRDLMNRRLLERGSDTRPGTAARVVDGVVQDVDLL